jgi:hypothetical protein
MNAIQSISGIVVFAMGIVVLIKLFQKEGVLKGILGLICMIYTFIWGWMHVKEQNLKNVMWIWTGLVILGFVLNIIAAVSSMGGN